MLGKRHRLNQLPHLAACMRAKSLQSCLTLRSYGPLAHQAPLSMGFSSQEYWSGLPCPLPGDLPDPGIKPTSLMSPALAGGFFTTGATWEVQNCLQCLQKIHGERKSGQEKTALGQSPVRWARHGLPSCLCYNGLKDFLRFFFLNRLLTPLIMLPWPQFSSNFNLSLFMFKMKSWIQTHLSWPVLWQHLYASFPTGSSLLTHP